MQVLQCQKCKRNLLKKQFDRKPDGSIKGWCQRCCRKQSKTKTRLNAAKKVRMASGLSYRSRDTILKQIGYVNYQEYLASELWQTIRARVFERKGSTCHRCRDAVATQVHHYRYSFDEMVGASIQELEPVCIACHKWLEFHGKQKLSVKQMRERRSKMFVSRDQSFTS